jgi:hypothetical protein
VIDENEYNDTAEETNNESAEVESVGRRSTPGKRKDGAERKERFDARNKAAKRLADRQALLLSEKQFQKQKAASDAAIAAILNRLTPEQRSAIEVNTEEFPGWRQLCGDMFEVVALCDLELFNGCRPDFVFEFYQEFVEKHPYAKDLIQPRAWFYDCDYRGYMAEYGDYLFAIRDAKGKVLIHFDRDAPIQFSVDQFLKAVKEYQKWRKRTHGATDTIEEQPVKRGRGRPKRLPVPDALPAVDPALAASWSRAPEKPQVEVWQEHDAKLVALAVEKDVAEIAPTMPIVFPQ